MSVIAATRSIGPPGRRPVELGVRAVEVAGQALGIGEPGERTEVGPLRSFERSAATPCGRRRPVPARTAGTRRSARRPRDRRPARGPGTTTSASNARSQSSEASQPGTEPISANGVPPLNTRSPANSTEQSGSQTTTSSRRVGRPLRRGAARPADRRRTRRAGRRTSRSAAPSVRSPQSTGSNTGVGRADRRRQHLRRGSPRDR